MSMLGLVILLKMVWTLQKCSRWYFSELVEEYGFSKVSEPELTDVNFYNTLFISLSFNDNQCINLTCLIFV